MKSLRGVVKRAHPSVRFSVASMMFCSFIARLRNTRSTFNIESYLTPPKNFIPTKTSVVLIRLFLCLLVDSETGRPEKFGEGLTRTHAAKRVCTGLQHRT